MPQYATLNRLAELATDQWGLVTRRQAEGAGIPQSTLARLTAEGSLLRRVAQGVYRLSGAPTPDHLELRAAWLQLAPEIPAWKRNAAEGLVSHRSAAAIYGLGDLPADRHEFTLPARRQSRRRDVRLHVARVPTSGWIRLRGLPVTRPSRIASDLLREHVEPQTVASIIADAIRSVYDYPHTFAEALGPRAAQFGLRRGDGLALLRWLLDLTGDIGAQRWLEEARVQVGRSDQRKRSNEAERPQ